MAAFVVAACAMLLCVAPLAHTARRSTVMGAIVVFEAVSAIFVMVLMLLPEAFGRTGLFEFPVLVAGLMLAGGLVYVRSVEQWR